MMKVLFVELWLFVAMRLFLGQVLFDRIVTETEFFPFRCVPLFLLDTARFKHIETLTADTTQQGPCRRTSWMLVSPLLSRESPRRVLSCFQDYFCCCCCVYVRFTTAGAFRFQDSKMNRSTYISRRLYNIPE